MSTHRCQNYKRINTDTLLCYEEQCLREEGAKTRQDVDNYYQRHYPYAGKTSRAIVVDELFKRLQDDKPVEATKCRLPRV